MYLFQYIYKWVHKVQDYRILKEEDKVSNQVLEDLRVQEEEEVEDVIKVKEKVQVQVHQKQKEDQN